MNLWDQKTLRRLGTFHSVAVAPLQSRAAKTFRHSNGTSLSLITLQLWMLVIC